jgi:uncharacterized protein YjbI with pentapeptide repeats
MDDDIGGEFLLLARTNAVLSAFAVCTLLSISDGTLLYAKSTATLPLLAVPLSVSVIGLVFPAIILCACLVGRMLLARLRHRAGKGGDGIIAFALGEHLNAVLTYLVVFVVPIGASLYCLWRVAIVPGLYPHACLLSAAALLMLAVLGIEVVWCFPRPMPRWALFTAALAMAALAGAQLTPVSPAWHLLVRAPATIELPGADLQGMSAVGDARLFGANLAHATLRDSDLRGANLETALMAEAVLNNARADGAYFGAADLRRVDAEMASFTNAYLQIATARGANFNNSVMQGLHARRLQAPGADFQGIDAGGADFSEATLTNARFWGANLAGVNFAGANLAGAEFAGAIIDSAVLTCALVQGTNFSKAKGLVAAQLADTLGDADTKAPPYLAAPAAWTNPALVNPACLTGKAQEVVRK